MWYKKIIDAVSAWLPAVCGAVFFWVISSIGFIYSDEIDALVRAASGDKSKLLLDKSIMYSIWLGVIGVHATIGALAPILGYTLFTTSVTAASRIAPAGGVAALEIGWEKYLRNSIALLVASILGILLSPTTLGLVLALLATSYVAITTAEIFRQGFYLVERPEKYDESARKYLMRQVKNIKLKTSDNHRDHNLEVLNLIFNKNIQRKPSGETLAAKLYIGSAFSETTFIQARPGVINFMISEAASFGCILYRLVDNIPQEIRRGHQAILGVVGSPQVGKISDAPQQASSIAVDQEAITRLQKVLESAIIYASTPDVENLARLPLLATRHVAAVIQEALPAQRPHDAEYGLDVLGQMIDEIALHHGAAAITSDRFRWIYEIPAFFLGQIQGAEINQKFYLRLIISFIRGRLVVWLNCEGMDPMSRAYMSLLGEIIRSNVKVLENESMEVVYIREVPLLAKVDRLGAMVLMERELILCFIDENRIGEKHVRHRISLVKLIKDLVRYSGTLSNKVRVEVIVSVLAVSLYSAESSKSYMSHVEEVIHGFKFDEFEEASFAELMNIFQSSQELVDRWRWDWWELERKGSGAHWMSMTSWITRAAIVALAHVRWRLSYIKDEDLPKEDSLSTAIREIDHGGWLEFLPAQSSRAVSELKRTFLDLLGRRKAIIEAQVEVAPIDLNKVACYGENQVVSIKQEFVPHAAWLHSAGSVSLNLPIQGDGAGISRLLPKDAFVDESVLDIQISLMDNNVGSLLTEFELGQISKVLIENAMGEVAIVDGSGDSIIWNYVADLIKGDCSNILVIGVRVGNFEVYEEVLAAQNSATEKNKKFRFEAISESPGLHKGIIVLDVSRAIEINRAKADASSSALFRDEAPLAEGGVMVEVLEIDKEMRERWLAGLEGAARDEMISKYAQSIVSRIVWKFAVTAIGDEFRVYSISDQKRGQVLRYPLVLKHQS
ncbi:hypothetical protein, partial [Xanthomonas arboricola]|uniref:hypothetical protein n=1 Tax=Xanthomonas arboricola TaxID=56448 RepID=UPI0040407637